ncbi:hypothetical protein HC762_00950 [bacterium]|nr:hypothetical protein [bacterium]
MFNKEEVARIRPMKGFDEADIRRGSCYQQLLHLASVRHAWSGRLRFCADSLDMRDQSTLFFQCHWWENSVEEDIVHEGLLDLAVWSARAIEHGLEKRLLA